ncbi:hypothetical protein LTR66_017673 [Elasticomyces elasticus]|nr:hypothetical protein LTR66_017673 [Elasticomyces elasticus]
MSSTSDTDDQANGHGSTHVDWEGKTHVNGLGNTQVDGEGTAHVNGKSNGDGDQGNDQPAFPIPTISEINEVAYLIDLIRAQGGIRESLEEVEAMIYSLPQAALVSANSDAEMDELVELRFHPQSRLREVGALVQELALQIRITFN